MGRIHGDRQIMAASKQRALRSFAFLVACVLVHEAACTPTPASSVAMYGVSVDALQKQAVRLVLDNEYVAATTNAVSWATTAIGAFMAVAVGQAALQFSRNTAEFGTALTTFVTGALTTWWVWAVIVLALMCVGAHVHDTLQRDTAYSNQVHEEAQERQDEETRMTDGWTNEAALAGEKPGRFGNVFHIVDLLQAKNNELEALKAKRERLQKMMAYDNENRMHRDVYTRYLCWQRCSTNVLDCCKNPVNGLDLPRLEGVDGPRRAPSVWWSGEAKHQVSGAEECAQQRHQRAQTVCIRGGPRRDYKQDQQHD